MLPPAFRRKLTSNSAKLLLSDVCRVSCKKDVRTCKRNRCEESFKVLYEDYYLKTQMVEKKKKSGWWIGTIFIFP